MRGSKDLKDSRSPKDGRSSGDSRSKKSFGLFVGITVVLLTLSLLAGGYFYVDSLVYKVCRAEAGMEVRAEDFFKAPGTEAVFADADPGFDTQIPGEYRVRVKSGLLVLTCTLHIQDTIAPQGTVNSVALSYGQLCRPEDFVSDIRDATAVSVTFEEAPDFERWGEQDVVILLSDISGNETRLETQLSISPVLGELEWEAGTAAPTVDDFAVAGEERELLTADLDTAVPSRQKVSVRIDGIEYDSILSVVDTTPPAVTVQDVRGFTHVPIPAEAFLTSAQDVTAVTASYEEEPDLALAGSREVSLIFADESGNVTKAGATLTLEEDTEPPVILGARDINYIMGTTISYKSRVVVSDNSGAELALEVDNSSVNLEAEGVYPVTYSAVDFAGNAASVTVNVTVRPMAYDLEEVYARADAVLAKIFKDEMTPLERLRAIYNYVKGNVGYISHSEKEDWVRAAYEGLVQKQGDCYVYACTTKVLLDRAGITNMDIEKIPAKTMHYWNLVDIGEGWHHLDTTPRVDHPVIFYWTEAELMEYSNRNNKSHNYDHTLYPEVP